MSNKNSIEQGKDTRKRMLKSIADYIEIHGYAPSYSEIGEMVGLKSKSSVFRHIHKLFETGELETDLDYEAPRAFRVASGVTIGAENE